MNNNFCEFLEARDKGAIAPLDQPQVDVVNLEFWPQRSALKA